MSKKNEAVEIIVKHKANNITKGNERYEKHIESVLEIRYIKASKKAVEAFKMGAVDAMIYDVAPTLGFRPSYKKRLEMLKEIFSNSI